MPFQKEIFSGWISIDPTLQEDSEYREHVPMPGNEYTRSGSTLRRESRSYARLHRFRKSRVFREAIVPAVKTG